LWLYFALLLAFLTLYVTVEIMGAMEVMAITVGMVVVIMDMVTTDMVNMDMVTMDKVTMVITKHLFLLSIEALKIVQEQVLLQSVFGTSIYLLTHSHNKARHEFSERNLINIKRMKSQCLVK
jgi:hypothetical protein